MKIVICVDYTDNSACVSQSFAKAQYFFIYDADNEKLYDKLTNHINYSSNADIFCAQLLIKRGVDIVVCGRCDNNAKKLFDEANVTVIEDINISPTAFLTEFYSNYRMI